MTMTDLDQAEWEVDYLSRLKDETDERLRQAVERRNQLRRIERREAQRDLLLAQTFLGPDVRPVEARR